MSRRATGSVFREGQRNTGLAVEGLALSAPLVRGVVIPCVQLLLGAPRRLAVFRWRRVGMRTGGAAARSAARRSSRVSARYQPACTNGAGGGASGVASMPSRSLGVWHACMMSLGVMRVPPSVVLEQGTTRSAPASVSGLPQRPDPSPPSQGTGGAVARRAVHCYGRSSCQRLSP